MYCPEKLKLNKFVRVNIPSPAQIFGRFGVREIGSDKYTGEESFPAYQTKVDAVSQQLQDYNDYCNSANNE